MPFRARIFQEYINDWRVRAHISEIPGKIPLWDFIADDQFSQVCYYSLNF
jgi:hypothetical protein